MATHEQLRVSLVRVGDVATPVPQYTTAGAAGLDLAAALTAPLSIGPGRRALVGTGWAMAIPEGYEAQVRPRSGLALRHGVTVLNTPGTVDCDYRGEIKVLLINLGDEVFVVNPGDRIAQIVVCPVTRVALEVTARLDDTGRGAGGYGSTGVAS